MLPTIITHAHAWAEVARPDALDWTLLCPCEGRPLNQEAANRATNRTCQMMEALAGRMDGDIPEAAIEATRLIFSTATQTLKARGVALRWPRSRVWTSRDGLAGLLVWGVDLGDRLHLRIVARPVTFHWFHMASRQPFGLVPWPDHWPHSGDPEAPSLKDDPTLWRVLYPELAPPQRPHTFQHRELLYAALDEPGDFLHWDILADAVEEQGEDPSKERFASRLLREVILPPGMQMAPGLVQTGGAG